MMPSTIAGNTSPDPAAGDLAGPIQHTELENENSGQVATPPPEPDDFTSDAPLIEAYGNIKSIWPDDCENELPKLGEKQTRDIVSTLLEDTISISFSQKPERIRQHSNILPTALFRTHYETSTTLSRNVDEHTHPKHRANIRLKLGDKNSFRSIGNFAMSKDVTRERIERHLVWNKKIDPSSFISAFNHISHAKRRCEFHYDDSQRIGHRVLVAMISTKDLVAATIHAQMKTTVTVTTKELLGYSSDSATKIRDVTIPVWIRKSAIPSDGSAITDKDWVLSRADMWMSITEIRRSDLKKHTPNNRKYDTVAAKGHDYEWLACGFVPTTCIMRVMPWDGKKLHTVPDTRIVRSIGSPYPWVWDYHFERWRLDARLYRTACFLAVFGGSKRKVHDVLAKAIQEPKLRRRRTSKKITKTKKALLENNPYSAKGSSDTPRSTSDGVCCDSCGQKKVAFQFENEVSGPLAYLDLASATTAPASKL